MINSRKTTAPNRRRILLADDEEMTREMLSAVLEGCGFEVVAVESGALAKERISNEIFDLVLSDIRMPNSTVGGIELLEHSKKISEMPVILMTGFASLSETDRGHQMGAFGFLAKPFKKDELLNLINSALLSTSAGKNVAMENLDGRYSKVNIKDFISGKQIQFSIYIRLSPFKYVKIAHQGEDLNMERVLSYQKSGIRHLYLERSDFHRYVRMSLALTDAARSASWVDPQKKLNLLKHTAELVLNRFYCSEIDQEAFDDARSIIESTVDLLASENNTLDLIQSLNTHSDTLYAHSVGVSFYASLLAKVLGLSSASSMFRLSIAGLFHDIGKKEIDRAILEKPRGTLTQEEVKILESHPKRALEILGGVESIPEDVLQIILHHHERDAGNGYPSGLRRQKIHPLARVIAVADEFVKLILKGPDTPGMDPKAALIRLSRLQKGELDGKSLEALAGILHIDIQREPSFR